MVPSLSTGTGIAGGQGSGLPHHPLKLRCPDCQLLASIIRTPTSSTSERSLSPDPAALLFQSDGTIPSQRPEQHAWTACPALHLSVGCRWVCPFRVLHHLRCAVLGGSRGQDQARVVYCFGCPRHDPNPPVPRGLAGLSACHNKPSVCVLVPPGHQTYQRDPVYLLCSPPSCTADEEPLSSSLGSLVATTAHHHPLAGTST